MGSTEGVFHQAHFQPESGATLTEFALVLPVLILFFLGIVQWGLIFSAFITLRNASAIAAREATLYRPPGVPITNLAWQSQIASVAAAAVTPALDPSPSYLTTNITPENVSSVGDGVGVQLNYNLQLFFPNVVPNATGNLLVLNAKTVMK